MTTEHDTPSPAELTLTRPPTRFGMIGKLPRELRDIVYHYANPPIHGIFHSPRLSKKIPLATRNMPLLRCSKMLRVEGIETWFHTSEIIEEDWSKVSVFGLVLSLGCHIDLPKYAGKIGVAKDFRLHHNCEWSTRQEIDYLANRTTFRYHSPPRIPAKKLFIYVQHRIPSLSPLGSIYNNVFDHLTGLPEPPECNIRI